MHAGQASRMVAAVTWSIPRADTEEPARNKSIAVSMRVYRPPAIAEVLRGVADGMREPVSLPLFFQTVPREDTGTVTAQTTVRRCKPLIHRTSDAGRDLGPGVGGEMGTPTHLIQSEPTPSSPQVHPEL